MHHQSPKKISERGQSIVRRSANALTVSCDRYERRARAYNFRASFRLTSSRTGKIYEKNACQRGDGIYENSRFAPVGSVSFPPRPLSPRSSCPFPFRRAPSSLFLVHPFPSRNLVHRYIQKVHRLVMYFLRYIKAYILWDVRITRRRQRTAGVCHRLRGTKSRRHANNVKGASEWLMRLQGSPLIQLGVIDPSPLNYT